MIYLASPYSHPDPVVVEHRFEAACQVAATLIRQGKTVFSPIAHSHSICRYGLPGDWQFWQRPDRKHLGACDEVIVLQESHGVQAEIALARALGKPVSFVAISDQAEENPGQSRG